MSYTKISSMSTCVILFCLFAFMLVSCHDKTKREEVDRLNDISYQYHYRDLDSTFQYAIRARSLAADYNDGEAEALNNLAFVYMARMDYARVATVLDSVLSLTDNQLELLVANVQFMRLCQRRSANKDFYHYRQQAITCMRRLDEDEQLLSARQQHRLTYAKSEYAIVWSTYLYYMKQHLASAKAISEIDASGAVVKDTAQLLAYYYNVGAGGILTAKSHSELMQLEFDYLMRCYLLSRQYHYIFWEANSLQAISEHLQRRSDCRRLSSDNVQEIDFLNVDQMPDSLLAGNLAQRALVLFERYGDVYQTAGAWRTLSEAYRSIGDYSSALVCLDNALGKDTLVNSAPDLVASIREQLSIVYSAMDNKPQSDLNRNIYLDLQERTRQDRFLEARAEQLDNSLQQLDMMIVAVAVLIVIVVGMLVYFGYWRHKYRNTLSFEDLHVPLDTWKAQRAQSIVKQENAIEELQESISVTRSKYEHYRERNIEQRAKVWLASSVVPLINRMVREAECLRYSSDPTELRVSRLEYISQIADSIDVCNRQLTRWIKLRQGDFLLHIESFELQPLFDTIKQNTVNFRMRGVCLEIDDTPAVVKADRTLTLFMINTMADNARKHTPVGGKVKISALVDNGFVEISILDNGCGMSQEKAEGVFKHNVISDSVDTQAEQSHGFGLINCRGIIDKYRKLSTFFDVCSIGVDSEEEEGSRFYFRLPCGMLRMLVAIMLVLADFVIPSCVSGKQLQKRYDRNWTLATAFADSAYFSNINGRYSRTVAFADSCIYYVDKAIQSMYSRKGNFVPSLRLRGDYPTKAVELRLLRDSAKIDFDVILDVRNETAVAALALHDWSLYNYNNAVYTQLFRELSADNSLSAYVRSMQTAESNRNVAIVMLVSLLFAIFPTYYFIYYRRRMSLHKYIDDVISINTVLDDSRKSSKDKLSEILSIWTNDSNAKNKRQGSEYERPADLCVLVDEICMSLRCDVEKMDDLELRHSYAVDELKRLSIDCDRVYISNNVLDNCLSSLKHETMYYPSRLRQLVTLGYNDDNVITLVELANYYRTLYTTLISQAYQILQGAGPLAPPELMKHYLLSLLKKKNLGRTLSKSSYGALDGYAVTEFKINNDVLSVAVGDKPSELFTTATPDADFLVCCQIMRDLGEYTGARGCGIAAVKAEEGCIIIRLRYPVGFWKF